jgi:glutamate-ammonia-ligase adenylyltransferase
MRLRPTGKSGSLVIPLCEFCRYFGAGHAQVWERQSLVRSRVVHGDPAFAAEVMSAVREAIRVERWGPEVIDEIRQMREKLEATASPRSLKRGPGGLMDIEFIVQMFQMKYGGERPGIVLTNTWEALDALAAAGLIDAKELAALSECYSFLRSAEARLRIVTNRPLNEYPEATDELEKFARRMGFAAGDDCAAHKFRLELRRHAESTRKLFDEVMRRERSRGC